MNKVAEKALLCSVFVNDNREMLARLEKEDFSDAFLRFLFLEFQQMVAGGHPLGDSVAFHRWFRQATVIARGREVVKGGEAEVDRAVLLWLGGQTTEYVTKAHDEYYLACLRESRLSRAILSLTDNVRKKLSAKTHTPHEVLRFLSGCSDKMLKKFGDRLLPKQ